MVDRLPQNSLGWFFLIALLIHAAISLLAFPDRFLPGLNRPGKAKDSPIELFDAKSDKPVVKTEKAEKDIADDKPAHFAGEFRNRVEKESQAQRKGRFQEESRIPTVPHATGPGEEGAMPGQDLSDLMAFPQSPNALPGEIAKGNRTLLNTDPVLYASFINRVADEIYDPWVSHAQSAVDKVYASGRRLDAAVYITKLTVVINREGAVAAIKVLQSCGIRELDEAPKKAFWESEPFPNPPSQMFDEDGLVRFVYEFHFEWKSSGFNIIPLI